MPLFGKVVFMEDCFHGTLRDTCFTVDAFFRVDIEHLVALVETLYRTNDNAIGVFASVAWLGNDVSHVNNLL